MPLLHRHLLLPVLCLLPAFAAPPAPDAAKAFQQLSALTGEWEGKFANGRVHRVTYRLSAGGTVLVETWALAPGRESMTLYHLDGPALVASHYCPQGNVPRLELASSEGDTLRFRFRDGANLQEKGKAHQHAFWIQLRGKDAYARSETYVENGSSAAEIEAAKADEPVVYTRVRTLQETR